MSLDESDVLLIFLERGDDPLTNYGIANALGVDHHDLGQEVRRVVARMVQDEILVEFDVENDALDGILIEHEKYGTLDNNDLTYFPIDNLFALGPRSFQFVDEHKSQLMDIASNRGLGAALLRLKDLRIDSSSWTGLPAGFSFTPQTQAKVVQLLEEAIEQVRRSKLGNNAKAQAGAYLRTALILAQAPDPPPDLIAEVLRRLRYVGEAIAFFSSIVGLFAAFGIKL